MGDTGRIARSADGWSSDKKNIVDSFIGLKENDEPIDMCNLGQAVGDIAPISTAGGTSR